MWDFGFDPLKVPQTPEWKLFIEIWIMEGYGLVLLISIVVLIAIGVYLLLS